MKLIGKIYVVEQHGQHEYDTTSLTQALRHIGEKVHGSRFGCMMVTAQEAVTAGFSIRQC